MNGLYTDCILASPISFDWSRYDASSDSAGWEMVLPQTSEWEARKLIRWVENQDSGVKLLSNPKEMGKDELLAFLASEDDNERKSNTVEELVEIALDEIDDGGGADGLLLEKWREIAQEWFEENRHEFEPVMNYFYSLDKPKKSPEELQEDLWFANLPLTIVKIADEPVLVLTGGGQNLSDRIIAAYVLCGYHPPFYFEPPEMAGFPGSEADRQILRECLVTCDILEGWITRRREHLNSMLAKREGRSP